MILSHFEANSPGSNHLPQIEQIVPNRTKLPRIEPNLPEPNITPKKQNQDVLRDILSLTACCSFHTYRCRLLVAAVAPPQLLNGLVGRPRQLERDVQAATPLRARTHGGVEGNPGAGGVADDGHLFLAGHEQLTLANVEAVVLRRNIS